MKVIDRLILCFRAYPCQIWVDCLSHSLSLNPDKWRPQLQSKLICLIYLDIIFTPPQLETVLSICVNSSICRNVSVQPIESTTVTPRSRPKGQAVPQVNSLGLPIQTSVVPRKRPTPVNPNPVVQQNLAGGDLFYTFLLKKI